MLAVETKANELNPMTVFFHKIKPAINALKGVKWCNLAERQKQLNQKAVAPYHHNLKIEHEFRDAVLRYSYLAKTNDKANIPPSFVKTFQPCQIQHNKYYSIAGKNNMLKISEIHKSQSFNVFPDLAANKIYKAARKFKHVDDEVVRFFHFNDVDTNETVGFYSLSFSHDNDEGVMDLVIALGDVYINDPDKYTNWLDSFYFHLEEQVSVFFSTINDLDQQPIITTYCDNDKALEILDLVVESVCLEHDVVL